MAKFRQAPTFIGPHIHPVTIYYEDTDFSGVVYHANYLKFFERAREHALGIDVLRKLYEEQGIGFVVHRLDMRFREGARHGDTLEIHSRVTLESPYRAVFEQTAVRPADNTLMVEGTIHLVCVNANKELVPLPQVVTAAL